MFRLPRNEKQIYILCNQGIKRDHEILPWPWPWIFKVKYEICHISTVKWSDYHEMKSQHMDWILGTKCNHWIWPWPWPWPWIFKVKFWNSGISGIGGPIDIEQKGVIHDHDRDLIRYLSMLVKGTLPSGHMSNDNVIITSKRRCGVVLA